MRYVDIEEEERQTNKESYSIVFGQPISRMFICRVCLQWLIHRAVAIV
jgi:hypothetical protein